MKIHFIQRRAIGIAFLVLGSLPALTDAATENARPMTIAGATVYVPTPEGTTRVCDDYPEVKRRFLAVTPAADELLTCWIGARTVEAMLAGQPRSMYPAALLLRLRKGDWTAADVKRLQQAELQRLPGVMAEADRPGAAASSNMRPTVVGAFGLDADSASILVTLESDIGGAGQPLLVAQTEAITTLMVGREVVQFMAVEQGIDEGAAIRARLASKHWLSDYRSYNRR
jgi:hypothetical protein